MGTLKYFVILLFVAGTLSAYTGENNAKDRMLPGFVKDHKPTGKLSKSYITEINETVAGKGLFRATLTFATGYMPGNKLNNLYLTGNIEYYADDRVSLRGDGVYFFNSMNGDKTLKQNHSIYSGAAYHFAKKQFDPFVGLQAGLAYTQAGIIKVDGSECASAFNPLISPIAGFNYYAPKWFHLFINMRYNVGKHLADDAIIPLNEVSFSFGLGFNIK